MDCFRDWITDHEGLLNIARWARYYLLVYQKYFPKTQRFRYLRKTVYDVIAESNLFFINTLKTLIFLFNSQTERNRDFDKLYNIIKKDVIQKHSQYKLKLNELINDIERLVN